MDLRQSRPSYEYKSSFWPPAGIMMMVVVVRASNYNYNYCRAKLLLLSPEVLKNIEYGLEAKPSIL